MIKLVLHKGREKSLLRRHPWVFSGAIKSASQPPQSGDVVALHAEDGRFLAQALFGEHSQIAARALSFNANEVIDDAFFRERIKRAVSRRQQLQNQTSGVRLIHAESDGLPGLIVDRYADVAVMQVLTAGMESRRDMLGAMVSELCDVKTVYERSDADVRSLEGLPARSGWVAGAPLAPETVFEENGLRFYVDIANGHKTGFYLDQRDNRALVKAISADAEVLNCFCYSGGMSVAALMGGAKQVHSIDSSGPALAWARRNMELNGVDLSRAEFEEADVFAALRKLRDMNRKFDLIILDPPKFAPTSHHVEKATRAYKDINLLAFKLLRLGGKLMTYSCSGGISPELFQKIVAGAELDAQVDALILRRLQGGEDHPVALNFPEGDYLKGLLCQRIS